MDAQTRAEFDALKAEVAQLRAAGKQRGAHRRWQRRAAPLVVAGLLTMVPFGLFAAGPTFSDLGEAAPVHQPNIQAIGDAGITTGFADPNDPTRRTYNPKSLVTREEMASFLARVAGLGGNPPVVNATTAQRAQTAGTAQEATTAQRAADADRLGGQPAGAYQRADQPIANATQAQVADRATNADQATNAAQLGGRPPSGYQLADQPIANAVNAQSAVSAQNAATVGGYAPDGLTRFAFSRSVGNLTVSSAVTPVGAVTITVPQQAYVLVQFSGYWYAQAGSGCPCTFQANLRTEDGNSVFVLLQNLTDANAANGTIRDTAAGSYLFVAPAGTHTYTLTATQSGSTNAGIAFPALQALMFPLGPTGEAP